MGKLFIVHPDSKHVFGCKECRTPIVARQDFIGQCKTLIDGQGLLFSSSCNVKEAGQTERILSGADENSDIVRFLSCLKCKAYMGWR